MPDFSEIANIVLISTATGVDITIGKLFAVFVLLLLGYGLSRFVGYLLGRRLAKVLKPDSTHTIKRIAFFTILVLVVLTALSLLGVPITAFAFATGAIAIGVGFGAQNIINNFISGWILMAERPIRIDDFIEIDGTLGTVERIGNRSTRIRRVDGVHLLVPNSQLLERTVINWTLVDYDIRTSVKVGVAYGSPVEKVSELLLAAVKAQPDVNPTPEPIAFFDDFGDSALIFEVFFWCKSQTGERQLRQIRSAIRFELTRLFAENDITIAFPQMDVHIDGPEPLRLQVAESATDSKHGQ